jgi:hypothetical protein
VDDFDAREEALLRAIATLRAQLTWLPRDDVRRIPIYRDLLWCYHEVFVLIFAHFVAWRAEQSRQHEQPDDADH